MAIVWKAPNNVSDILTEIIEAHHTPRLSEAHFAIAFSDTKPFIKNNFNWGRVSKFNDFNKLWQGQPGYDFSIVLCADVWHNLLSEQQRKAYLDLQVTRCGVEMMPEVVKEGKKEKPVKDEWGRIKYTNQMKLDDEGNPKWKVEPLGLEIFLKNVDRYGLWMMEFVEGSEILLEEDEEVANGS